MAKKCKQTHANINISKVFKICTTYLSVRRLRTCFAEAKVL